MREILHTCFPADLSRDTRLPGVKPLQRDGWIRCDEVYDAQMAYRRHLIETRPGDVVFEGQSTAHAATSEVLDEALKLMPDLGFQMDGDHVRCPDGVRIKLQQDAPMATLGQLLQQDICLLQKHGDEHVLTAAVLCFPASWSLAEKTDRSLTTIHGPVASYDTAIATRVQRLFDGVQVGKPLWRNNMLWYDDPDLYQPRRHQDTQRNAPTPEHAAYRRAERQCILRLPVTKAVVFSIHSYVTRAQAANRSV